MNQLEPILGTTTSSYFYPMNTNSTIPDGIVQRRRQVFVEPNHNNNNNIVRKKNNATLNIFDTPATSSDELHSLSRQYYPVTRVQPSDTFSSISPRTNENENRISARVRVRPPPSYAEITKIRGNTPERERVDLVRFGITAPSDLIRDGPIWVNSGPPAPSMTQDVHFAKLWKPSTTNESHATPKIKRVSRHHVITRFDQNIPSLTINVSHEKGNNKKGETRRHIAPISDTQQSENDGWSCRTDWRYIQHSPRITEVTRMEKQERNNKVMMKQSMGVEMNGNSRTTTTTTALDNISLGSSRRTSEDHGSVTSDSSQIMSMQEQIVRYSANSANNSYPSKNFEEIMSDRETALVVRLERELTDAQHCNHRLNQQLKTLANSSDKVIKKELNDTKKQLKDRVNEVEQLKKQVAKTESDRMWMSKQPNDVSTLMAEKTELRKQLDREQSEKQELFMQINSMIAQLADAGDQNEINRLKTEVSSLKRELETEKISSNAEASRLQSDLMKARRELDNSMKDGDKEKEQMEAEIEDLQKQLVFKNASIESLKFAVTDTSKVEKLSEENEKLKSESDELRRKLATSTSEIVEKQSEIMRLRDVSSVNDVSKQKMEQVQERLISVERQLNEEQVQKDRLRSQTEELKMALGASEEALSRLKSKISVFEEDATSLKRENDRLQQTQREATSFDSGRIQEINQQLSAERENRAILETQLKEKDGKIDKIKVALLSCESRAQQAEADLKAMEARAQTSERKEQQIEAQLKAAGDSNQQMELLRNELTKAEERYQLIQGRLQKAEGMVKEKETEYRQRSDSLESAQEETNRLMKQIDQIRKEKEDIVNMANDSNAKFNAEVANLKMALKTKEEMIKQMSEEIEDICVENKKLESKASVADEITTLMSSLNSARQENAQYEEDVRLLQTDIRSIREELYQQQDECAQWKMRAEKAETDVEHHTQKVQLLQTTQDSSHSKMESENTRLEELVEKMRDEKESARKEAAESVTRMKNEMTEKSITADREIRDLKEKLGSMTRELESSKRRIEQLQEDQCKFIGSQDEMKTELLKEVREYQDKAESINLEMAALKSNNANLKADLEEANENMKRLKEKNEKLEEKYDDIANELRNSEEIVSGLRDNHMMNGDMEKKLEELQTENKKRIDKMAEEHKNEVDKQRDELRKANTEHASLEAVIEEQQKELIKHREETDTLQDQLRTKQNIEIEVNELKKKLTKIEEENKELIEKINGEGGNQSKKMEEIEEKLIESNKTNESLIENVKEMTQLLTAESKRLEEVGMEKKKLEEEMERMKEKVKEGGTNDNERINELTNENARLAGELLKSHTLAERSLQTEREQIAKQFEERLKSVNLEKTRLASELQMAQSTQRALENQLEEHKQSLDSAEKRRRTDIHQMELLREDLHTMRQDYEKLQQNGPVAPPRSARTISNMSAMTNWTQADFSDCEDLQRLRGEIDKQKRLIIVLRRKLTVIQNQQ